MFGGEEPSQKLENATPETLTKLCFAVLHFFENYGWFILIGSILAVYLVTKLKPFINKWINQLQDYSSKKTDDPNQIFIQQEMMERSRQLMQEKVSRDAQKMKEKKLQHEAEKRRERIEDWDRHQLGKGYRLKSKRPQDDSKPELPRTVKPKPKRVLRPNDYNPLMGHRSGSNYKPPSRGGE